MRKFQAVRLWIHLANGTSPDQRMRDLRIHHNSLALFIYLRVSIGMSVRNDPSVCVCLNVIDGSTFFLTDGRSILDVQYY